MSKSLAEMRQSPRASLPERAYALCLAQGLVAEAQSLEEERAVLAVEPPPSDPDVPQPPRRMSEAPPEPDPRIAEIDGRLEALWGEMREHTGELRLRGVSDGEWRRWVAAHPSREDNKRDDAAAYGFCNADDLADDLGTYAASWNGDPLGEGDWEFIANRAAPGDVKELCRIVVQMHEVAGAQAPKGSPRATSATSLNVTAQPSPGPSASASSGSSDGSPASDTSTSTPTGT